MLISISQNVIKCDRFYCNLVKRCKEVKINKKNVKLDGKLKEKMSLFYAKLILMVLNDSVLDCSWIVKKGAVIS